MLVPKRLGRSAPTQSNKFQSGKSLIELIGIDLDCTSEARSMLSPTGMAAMDFASKGLNARRGMVFPIDAKNYCNSIGKITDDLIDYVSDVHKTPAKVKLDNLLLSNQ
jgi:hypothetical protein